jgi:hypothetical protein
VDDYHSKDTVAIAKLEKRSRSVTHGFVELPPLGEDLFVGVVKVVRLE